MKKLYFLTFMAALLVCAVEAGADEVHLINNNPDPSGARWISGGYNPEPVEPMSAEQTRELLETVRAKRADGHAPQLPSRVDHSFSVYMRPVFNQAGGSCGSAARVAYHLGYELNAYRDVDGSLEENMYPSHFTWLLTDQGSSKHDMMIFNGVPNAVVYGGDLVSTIYGGDVFWPDEESAPDYGWMHGHDNWLHAMQNRLEKSEDVNIDSPESLELTKHWLFDHFADTDFMEGGLSGTGVAITGMTSVIIPEGEYEAGKYLLTSWGPQIDHAMTWSGYDDDVGFDFNADGQITNDIDVNDDGTVDYNDWEKGALIGLNSWGDNWQNSGTVYVPYRTVIREQMKSQFMYIRKGFVPVVALKIKLSYSERTHMQLLIGASENMDATEPDLEMVCHHFNNAGNGEVPLLGRWTDDKLHDEPMEFMIDLTNLFDSGELDPGKPLKYFFRIVTAGAGGKGSVAEMTLVNNPTGSAPTEEDYPETDIPIASNYTYTFAFPETDVDVDGDGDPEPDTDSDADTDTETSSEPAAENPEGVETGACGCWLIGTQRTLSLLTVITEVFWR